jgi:hypothetical protein
MARTSRGGACCRVFWGIVLLALGGVMLWGGERAWRLGLDFRDANTRVSDCKSFSQTAGGGCGWACFERTDRSGVDTCQWCTTPPSSGGVTTAQFCVGNAGNASFDPQPVAKPGTGTCSSPTRAATCSQCQYDAGSASLVVGACGLVATGFFFALCAQGACGACCGALCCCCCLGSCAGLSMGGAGVITGGAMCATGRCRRCRGKCCDCCAFACSEDGDAPSGESGKLLG